MKSSGPSVDPSHRRIAASLAGQRARGFDRRLVDRLSVRRRDERHTASRSARSRPADFSCCRTRPDILAMTSRNRTIEAMMTTSWSVRCVPVEYRLTMIASVRGAVSDTTARATSRVARQAGLHLGRSFGELAHAGVQRRGAEQEIERGPAALQVARLVVVAAVESEPPVDRVGDEQRDDAGEQEVERLVLLGLRRPRA